MLSETEPHILLTQMISAWEDINVSELNDFIRITKTPLAQADRIAQLTSMLLK